MSIMRAKLRVVSVDKQHAGQETVVFAGVAKGTGYGTDGLDENNTFAKFSPTADFKIVIANPRLLNAFAPDQEYYVDFKAVQSVPAGQPSIVNGERVHTTSERVAAANEKAQGRGNEPQVTTGDEKVAAATPGAVQSTSSTGKGSSK